MVVVVVVVVESAERRASKGHLEAWLDFPNPGSRSQVAYIITSTYKLAIDWPVPLD